MRNRLGMTMLKALRRVTGSKRWIQYLCQHFLFYLNKSRSLHGFLGLACNHQIKSKKLIFPGFVKAGLFRQHRMSGKWMVCTGMNKSWIQCPYHLTGFFGNYMKNWSQNGLESETFSKIKIPENIRHERSKSLGRILKFPWKVAIRSWWWITIIWNITHSSRRIRI